VTRNPALPILLVAVLAGCAGPAARTSAHSSAPPYSCLLPSEQRMIVAELFFGRAIPGREPLTLAEWTVFAADTITPNFPDGFTAFDGEGQWRDPQTGRIAHEPTKIVLIAAPREPALAARLRAVIDAYRARFRQQSVGLVTSEACAAF
jgi:hypothetical protein